MKILSLLRVLAISLRAGIRRKGVVGIAIVGIDIRSYLVVGLLVEHLILCIIGVSIVVLTVVIGARDYL